MSNQRSTLAPDSRLPVYPLRTLRVADGQSLFVRTLSALDAGGRILGVMTHYKGRSLYCPGNACPAHLHREDAIWKGYVSCDVWDERLGLYVPHCLEVTESLELDMRSSYQRGQIWELTRLPKVKAKHFPVIGKLIENLDPRTVPGAFDMLNALRWLYHAQVNPCVPSPLPDRTMVEASPGKPPPGSKHHRSEKLTAPDPIAQAMLKQRLNGTAKEVPNG